MTRKNNGSWVLLWIGLIGLSFALLAGTECPVSLPCLDGDGDGVAIMDIGAVEYANPKIDTDRDGQRDLDEIAAGTDAGNAKSYLGILAVSNGPPQAAAGLVVSWSSVTGKYYRVDRGTNLVVAPAVFDYNVGSNIMATPPVNTITDSNATGTGPFFYRIGVE